MIPQSKESHRTRRPETGWARARRLRRQQALRTWMPAVESPDGPPTSPAGSEGNIVRGED
ncbi:MULTISPECIES: hypothetical protein [unclassified Streptomyces]|uniref:hypothetical protein n=1 Tax=unclassified Streptomyces TaxID=2593676 RepID=UPI001F03DB37|nr:MULTISPECIES: hypothetical protein [unclassified Streptomyces]MCH0567388.1 hypothetical protein [Streptomyces sp. MUM 2J]MCH0571789.1 hypothetical protein [Streptomyces sp. MUM 136J]